MNADEQLVRGMRAYVYGPDSDKNWEACKEHWLTPDNVRWLTEQVKKEQGVTVINLSKGTVQKMAQKPT